MNGTKRRAGERLLPLQSHKTWATLEKHAERRAAQEILRYMTGQRVDPPFADWEVALFDPPPLCDPKQ